MDQSVAMELVRNKIYGSVQSAVFSFYDDLIENIKKDNSDV